MGNMVYSVLRVMQDLYHQPLGFRAKGLRLTMGLSTASCLAYKATKIGGLIHYKRCFGSIAV